jgi:uncharacterized protein (DUF1684 family)
MEPLEEFRARKDEFFRDDPDSPLTPEQRETFSGLRYFPNVEALHLRVRLETDGVDLDEPIRMQTTSGGIEEYRRAGVVRFDVEGEEAELTLYRSADDEGLFAPFRDATSGSESYGAGRYLDLDPPGPDDVVEVDLNHAYNPYCAYNPNWACPLPPLENWLRVPIRAGEQTFPGAHAAPAGG